MRLFTEPGRQLALAAGLILAGCSAENTLQPTVAPSLPLQATDSTATATGKDKVTICHKGQTLSVASPAVSAHLGHGDTVGACGTVPSPGPTPTPGTTPTPTPTPTPGLTCNGLGPFYWANWGSRYTPVQFTTLLAGTIAGTPAAADGLLASSACGGTDQVACMRRYLLADQLTINLTTANPPLPNPDGGSLALSCTTVGVTGPLNLWLGQGLAIHANPAFFTAAQIAETRDALANFAEN